MEMTHTMYEMLQSAVILHIYVKEDTRAFQTQDDAGVEEHL